jgi:hypothetical protein
VVQFAGLIKILMALSSHRIVFKTVQEDLEAIRGHGVGNDIPLPSVIVVLETALKRRPMWLPATTDSDMISSFTLDCFTEGSGHET